MSTRTQQLADKFEAATSELAAFVESTNAQEWATTAQPAPDTPEWSVGEDERRPVACLAYHIAAVIGIPHTLLLRDAAEGKPLHLVHNWTVDNVAEWNAGVAEEQVDVTGGGSGAAEEQHGRGARPDPRPHRRAAPAPDLQRGRRGPRAVVRGSQDGRPADRANAHRPRPPPPLQHSCSPRPVGFAPSLTPTGQVF